VVLAELCGRDLEFRWLMGDVSVKKSTLSGFRKNHLEELSDLSTQILAVLAHMGLLPATNVCVDGTVIRAAASCGASCSRKKLRGRIERLRTRVQETLAQPESTNQQAQLLEQRRQRMQEALEEMTRLGLTGDEDRMTLTEPDAPTRKLKTHNFAPAHNVQVTADLDSGAVIEVEVIDQGNDAGQLAPQLRRAQAEVDRVGQKMTDEEDKPGPIRAGAADSAYHDTRQLKDFEQQGIKTYVPDTRLERRPSGVSDAFLARMFSYDETTDTMTCPMGCPLRARKLNANQTAMTYQANAKTCANCPHKHECCPNTKGGRSVNRPLYPEIVQRVHQRTKSEQGKRFRKARSVTGEGVIARMVDRLPWRRCRTWGRRGAQAEAKWRQITHNLMVIMHQWQPLVLRAGLA